MVTALVKSDGKGGVLISKLLKFFQKIIIVVMSKFPGFLKKGTLSHVLKQNYLYSNLE